VKLHEARERLRVERLMNGIERGPDGVRRIRFEERLVDLRRCLAACLRSEVES